MGADPPGSRCAEWLRPELSRTAQAGGGCTPEADVVEDICGAQSRPWPASDHGPQGATPGPAPGVPAPPFGDTAAGGGRVAMAARRA